MASSAASAQETNGFYVRGYGMITTNNDVNLTVARDTGPLSFSGGTSFGGAVGHDYDGPWRAELEFTCRSSDTDNLSAPLATEGEYASTTFMLNGLYSFVETGPWKPYVGVGIGYVTEIDFDLEGGSAAGEYSDRGLLAGQMILGTDYVLSDRWSLFGEVRYFVTEAPQMSSASGVPFEADYRTVDAVLGVTLRF